MFVFIAICVITVLDQLSKTLVSRHLAHHETMSVIPGCFNLAHVHNTGAAWSMFHDSNGPLAIFSVMILACLVLFRKRLLTGAPAHKLAISMMIAGIIGNLLDRLRFASVVDLFDFHWEGHHFPTFNIADSSICIGVAIYVLCAFVDRRGVGKVGSGRDDEPGKENAASLPDDPAAQ